MRFTWNKCGMIFDAQLHTFPLWASHSLLQPTPLLIKNGEVIRMFVGMRDQHGQSSVGYIDLASKNPKEILAISSEPVLSFGEDGCFDDCGVVPSAVYQQGEQCYLYYAGYSLLKKVRFSVLGGLAVSESSEDKFKRASHVPVFERTDQHTLFRVPHTILKEDGKFKIWYGGGSQFFTMNDYTYPIYDIYYCETDDLSKISSCNNKSVLSFSSEDEYRVARPYVVRIDKIYCMFLCVATKRDGYRLAYAESLDGIHWRRCDEQLNIDVSSEGWDSQMMAYPSFVQTPYGNYLFYNGNDYGKNGFGYAELMSMKS